MNRTDDWDAVAKWLDRRNVDELGLMRQDNISSELARAYRIGLEDAARDVDSLLKAVMPGMNSPVRTALRVAWEAILRRRNYQRRSKSEPTGVGKAPKVGAKPKPGGALRRKRKGMKNESDRGRKSGGAGGNRTRE